jgi:hypothetical protein
MTQQECAAHLFSFGGGAQFFCVWAKVTTFSDPQACSISTVAGRCELGSIAHVPCNDPCEDGGVFGLDAIPSQNELVEMPCAPDGSYLFGPVGEWTEPSQWEGKNERYVLDCHSASPLPPDLCTCSPQACAAE